MKIVINDEKYGQIAYEESAWTGKKSICFNGVQLTKISKKEFALPAENGIVNVSVQGNYIKGAKLLIDGREIAVTPPVRWYEIAMSVAIFLLILVWGNSFTLCSILPVVGGAIGGAISGVFTALNLFIIKPIKNIGLKALISLGMCAASFAVCMGVGFAIVSAVA